MQYYVSGVIINSIHLLTGEPPRQNLSIHVFKSKCQNFENLADWKFHKFVDQFHKMRGDNSSAPSFSASLCSLCTENNSLASDFMFSLSLTCGFKCCWRNISRYTYVEQSIFLAVTWQLYRFPCHWLTHWLTHSLTATFEKHYQRALWETCDPWDMWPEW